MDELKEKYSEIAKFQSVYSGGQDIHLSHDGRTVICGIIESNDQVGINIIDKEDLNFSSIKKINLTEETVVSFVVSQQNPTLILATKSSMLQLWNWKTGKMIRHWKSGHSQRVSCMSLATDDARLLTGSSDRQLRVWRLSQAPDSVHPAVELATVLRTGADMPTLASCHPRRDEAVSVTRAEAALRVWDLAGGRERARLDGHAGEVTAAKFWGDEGKEWLVSCCQGKLILVWDLVSLRKLYTIPTLERLTSCVLVPSSFFDERVHGVPLILTGGLTGVLRLWRADQAACLMEVRRSGLRLDSPADEYSARSVVRLVSGRGDHFLTVRASASIEFHRLATPRVDFEWLGDVGDVRRVSLCGAGHASLVLAAAAASSQLLFFPRVGAWRGVTVETGHAAIADLAVSPDGRLLLTAGRDAVRLWAVEEEALRAVAAAREEAGQATAVVFGGSGEWAFSAGQDGRLRRWRVEEARLRAAGAAESGHAALVNCVAVDRKEKMLATASKDKTVKVWTVEERVMKERATLSHSRGVWSAAFSPTGQRLLTAAGDGVKLWSLDDLQCLATFGGDGGPVYRAVFLAGGLQCLACDQAGRLVLTTLKGLHAVQRSAAHQGRVWSVCSDASEQRVVTGSETGEVVVWKDVSEEERADRQAALVHQFHIEDKVKKLLAIGKLHRALKFTIKKDQPLKAYKIIRDIRLSDNPSRLAAALDEVMADTDDLRRLLSYCVAWNGHNQRRLEAKQVLAHLLTRLRPETLAELQFDFRLLLPHARRHLGRERRFTRAAMLAPLLKTLAAGVADDDAMK